MRMLMGWLWGFVLWRWLVLVLVERGPAWLGGWLAVNTPLFVALRQLMLDRGHYDIAAEIARGLDGKQA